MYKIYIDDVLLPVTPGKITTKIKSQNKTVSLLSGGEINILKSPGLTEIEFDALLPNSKYPFAIYEGGFKTADYYLTKLEELTSQKKPFYFSVSRLGPGGSLIYRTEPMRVSLEGYPVIDNAENGTDVMVQIKLKQYVDYGLKKITIITAEPAPKGTAKKSTVPTRPKPTPKRTYTVKSGDTLWAICQRELGSGTKYKEIAKLNNIPNPNKIYPGQVIKLA